MKPGRESQTAVLVAAARAAAHGRTAGVDFQDPTALALLPEEARGASKSFAPAWRRRTSAPAWRTPFSTGGRR